MDKERKEEKEEGGEGEEGERGGRRGKGNKGGEREKEGEKFKKMGTMSSVSSLYCVVYIKASFSHLTASPYAYSQLGLNEIYCQSSSFIHKFILRTPHWVWTVLAIPFLPFQLTYKMSTFQCLPLFQLVYIDGLQ